MIFAGGLDWGIAEWRVKDGPEVLAGTITVMEL